jgi:hypothetical protein
MTVLFRDQKKKENRAATATRNQWCAAGGHGAVSRVKEQKKLASRGSTSGNGTDSVRPVSESDGEPRAGGPRLVSNHSSSDAEPADSDSESLAVTVPCTVIS